MIRRATKEDLFICSKLIQQVIGQVNAKHYSPEIICAWQEYNALPNLEEEIKRTDFIVYEEKGVIMGVGAIKNAHLEKIYVLSEYQNKGIGKSLVQTLEKIAKERGINLCELNSTSNALKFYESLGYKVQGLITMEQNGLSVTFTKMIKYI